MKNNTDILEITALRIKTYIGVHAWEQRILQDLIFDLKVHIDCTQCKDNLSNTIDYEALCEHVSNFVSSQRFNLVETVAELVAATIKQNFPAINTLCLRVSKPSAIPNAGNVSIEIIR